MDWIMLVISFILGVISIFILVYIFYSTKQKERINKIHFYVARDKTYNLLWLYIGKPIRFKDDAWLPGKYGTVITTESSFGILGLNKEDYNSLKWEDEPVEVFINMDK